MATKPTDSGTTAASSSQASPNLPAHVYDQKQGMYKIAFDESVRALKDQVDELSGIRTRLVSFLAFIGAATAFLVGSSLTRATRDGAFYGLASLGTILLIATIAIVIALLRPGFSNFAATS